MPSNGCLKTVDYFVCLKGKIRHCTIVASSTKQRGHDKRHSSSEAYMNFLGIPSGQEWMSRMLNLEFFNEFPNFLIGTGISLAYLATAFYHSIDIKGAN